MNMYISGVEVRPMRNIEQGPFIIEISEKMSFQYLLPNTQTDLDHICLTIGRDWVFEYAQGIIGWSLGSVIEGSGDNRPDSLFTTPFKREEEKRERKKSGEAYVPWFL